MRVVGYIRVSTDKQADEGVSLECQADRIRAYAGLYDLEIVAIHQDAASGKTLERDGLRAALDMVASGAADGILVAKLDRLTRNVRDLGTLVDGPLAKSALFSVGEQIDTRTAGGRLVLNVLTSVAQWERETCAERTSSAMRSMSARGEYVGGRAAYGWQLVDGALVAHAGEQAVISAVREYRAAGLSLRAIGGRLAARGLLPRSGGSWTACGIQTAHNARVAA